MRADDAQRVTIARDYLASIRQTGVEQLPPSRLMVEAAESRRQLAIVLEVLDDQAAMLTRIRAVLDGFDWEFDDRQLALEAIDRIVGGEVMTAGPFESEAEVLALPAVRDALDAIRSATHRKGVTAEQHNYQLIAEVLAVAGVELGAYDHRIAGWLAGWETTTVAVIASWITRAHTRGGNS